MLTELCQELRNWFVKLRYFGTFTITDTVQAGSIAVADKAIARTAIVGNNGVMPLTSLQEGQYYRIIGSIFNDGVYRFPDDVGLTEETFEGAVWTLAIPKEVIALSEEIDAWRAKYESADSEAMSPFMSESFGGYSYSKGAGNSSSNSAAISWQQAFASRLNKWRKI